ncbi:hypothetical protein [Lactococcus lactis]|uniref:hypothetical protein n=1 Tax=Lactococcus lactis TaxID=1358 RepID=UPI001D093278|nr:hypothetical protein [Lactococcus lactis]MCB6852065.1 hypothetical protein [Lactococcus lactis]
MIEHHQGYTAFKRYGRNSFRPAGKHPFKMIYNAQAVKYDLIQQFEASTGIILPSRSEKQLMHATSANSRQRAGYYKNTDKGK